jgi:glutamate synthase (NADPH/NADH) small chain
MTINELRRDFDVVVLAGGARVPRDLTVPGRELAGIHFALDYLIRPNNIDARGKIVVVIGGGDTGADCIGTANRQGAARVIQLEILSKPAERRPADQPWPKYPLILKTSTSHEEGVERKWSVATKAFIGERGEVRGLRCVQVDNSLKELTESEFFIEAELVLLAMGFIRPEKIKGLEIELDPRGNFKTDQDYMTSLKGVFAAGDMRRGQSLVVWALYEGREAARAVNEYLRREKNG